MGRPRKSGPTARVQGIVAHNLRILIGHKYAKAGSPTEAYKKLASAAGTSLSQIQRATAGDAAVGVDTLEKLADALDTRVADLVTEGAFARLKGEDHAVPDTPSFRQHAHRK